MKVQRKSKHKLNVVFDENKRRDFLTGFHKRKLQRKKLAKEKLEEDLKKERKRIKIESKESYKKLIKSYAPLPEVEELLEDEYEDEEVNVKIVELSTNEIAEENNWIGLNQPAYKSSDEEDEADEDTTASEIPGMELKAAGSKAPKDNSDTKPKTMSEIKKLVKKQATKTVQKSKAFQQKNRIEKQKQRKRSAFKKKVDEKFQQKRKFGKKKVDDKSNNKLKKKRKK